MDEFIPVRPSGPVLIREKKVRGKVSELVWVPLLKQLNLGVEGCSQKV